MGPRPIWRYCIEPGRKNRRIPKNPLLLPHRPRRAADPGYISYAVGRPAATSGRVFISRNPRIAPPDPRPVISPPLLPYSAFDVEDGGRLSERNTQSADTPSSAHGRIVYGGDTSGRAQIRRYICAMRCAALGFRAQRTQPALGGLQYAITPARGNGVAPMPPRWMHGTSIKLKLAYAHRPGKVTS